MRMWTYICKHTILGELEDELRRGWDKLEDAYYWLTNGVRNLKLWLPVIWNDRQWMASDVYRVFGHKLKLQRECIERTRQHIGWEKIVRQMLICEEAMKRLQDDEYFRNNRWYKELVERFGRYSRITHERERVLTEEDRKLERYLFNKCVEHAEMQRKQDLAIFALTFAKHSRGWWD